MEFQGRQGETVSQGRHQVPGRVAMVCLTGNMQICYKCEKLSGPN